MATKNSLSILQKQVDYLEDILRGTQDALEMCAFFGDYQSSLNKLKNKKDIFDRAVQGLKSMIPLKMYSFYLVREKDYDLLPIQYEPKDCQEYITSNVEYLIETGTVAWALREGKSISSLSTDQQYNILVHALYTATKVKGVFFGFLDKKTLEMNTCNSTMITIIMKSTAYALENFELYKLIDEKNNQLHIVNEQLNREISQKEAFEKELRKSEVMYKNIFENVGTPTAIVDARGRIILVNSQFVSLSSYNKDELIDGKHICKFILNIDHNDFSLLLEQHNNQKKQNKQPEYIFQDKWHRNRVVLMNIFPLGIKDQYVVTLSDISKIKQVEEQLNYQAYHDSLTGLPNRAYLEERLEHAVQKQQTDPQFKYSLFFVDLDRLKIINDTLGHVIGDQVLIETAGKLRNSVRDVDLVARFGGDEYIILLEGIGDGVDCDKVLQRIEREFKDPIFIKGHEIYINLSIGILIGSRDYKSIDQLIRHADIGMYHAKKLGRNQYCYFNEQLGFDTESKLYLENQLTKAIKKKEIFLHYQPIMNLTTRSIFGIEVLVRWKHPELGLVSPKEFIPIAEEAGLIVSLGRVIFQLAFRQFCGWLQNYDWAGDLYLCINLSVKQLFQSDIVREIKEIAEQTSMPLSNLHLEITESVFVEDGGYASKVIDELKKLGISIAIDDFGTGYSSLKYLNQFCIDIIKVDKVLVEKMVHHETSYRIVESILNLSKNLNLKVIAEGIETRDQETMLRRLNCHLGQGFYYARPQEAQQMERFFQKSRDWGLV